MQFSTPFEKKVIPQVVDELWLKNDDNSYSKVSAEGAALPDQMTVVTDPASPLNVTGPLTDTQLRASAVPVSLPSNAAVTATIANTDPIPIDMVSGHFRPLPQGHNRSFDIAAADTWQQVVPVNRERTGFGMQIVADEGEIWVTEFDPATVLPSNAGAMRVQSGQVYWTLSSNAINVKSSTVGLAVTAIETMDD